MPAIDREAAASLSHDLDLMRDAAMEAGRIALSYMERGETQAWDKSPGHPVTEADLAVNRFLFERLSAARPDYGWLSEETADDSDRLSRRRIWVVDPIDGTRAFMRGDPHWCVGVALVEDGVSIAGVVYAPVLGELYAAGRDLGAWLNDEAISASERNVVEDCQLVTSEGLLNHPDWPEPWPSVKTLNPKPNATLYRLALVAAGRWDGALVLWRKSDWDLAAGAILIEEAGGLATSHDGEPFRFNRPVPLQRSLVAAGNALHPLLLRRTRAARLPDPQSEATDHTRQKEELKAMTDAPAPRRQLLHIVFGGQMKDVTEVEFEDLSKVDFVGAFPNYKEAYDAWKAAAQRTVDSAETRYFILHAHKLLDPETGVHHHA